MIPDTYSCLQRVQTMDDRLAAILALQRRLDRWRRGWHEQHRAQEAKAREGRVSRNVMKNWILHRILYQRWIAADA